jgi:SnoaL-like domain
MTTQEIAEKVVELTRKQAWHEALDQLYDKDIVSVESRSDEGGSPEKRGLEAVRGKADWWVNTMEIHSFKVSGPFVAHDRFVVQYDVDVTDKNSKHRFQMSEVGVYTVKNGKIVREEFLPHTGKE